MFFCIFSKGKNLCDIQFFIDEETRPKKSCLLKIRIFSCKSQFCSLKVDLNLKKKGKNHENESGRNLPLNMSSLTVISLLLIIYYITC